MGNSRASTIAAPLQARIAEIDAENGSLKEKLKEARAEVERLRAALWEIAEDGSGYAHDLQAKARRAINPPAKEKP